MEGDSDGDGLQDGDEVRLSAQRAGRFGHGFNPKLADRDGDGLADSQELTAGTPPADADADTGGKGGRTDGLSDADEILRYGTDAALIDTDGDRGLMWVRPWSRRRVGRDPLETAEAVYAELDYPEEMTSFARYMPSDDADLGDRELNEARLMRNWEAYLRDERSRLGTD